MIGETAQLVVQLTLKDQLSGGVAKAEGQLGRLNTAAKTSGTHMTTLVTASGKASKAITGLGGALGHASGKIGGLLSGPLGLIGLTGGILSLGGAIESSLHKVEDFSLGLEKITTLTGESAQASGALLLQFEKFGLSGDNVAQIAAFSEKTLGKLNETMLSGVKVSKSAELQNLETAKAQRQAAGESTTAISKLIKIQKGKDELIAQSAAKAAGGLSKLAGLDAQYGLQLVDTKGKVVDFSTELSQVAKFYDSNASASTKAYVASQVFGRNYAKLLPVLSQGAAGIKEAADEAKALGLDLGTATVQKMAAFRDQMRSLGEQVNILQLQIGMALVPAISEAAKAVSNWLSSGGSQQIVDVFKGGAMFAEEFGKAVTTFVVPAFSAIANAWGAIPGPLKTILIGGLIANKAGKFLFDKSLFGGLKGLLGQQVSKLPVVGGLLDSAAGVQHVWVDNPGFGGPGGLFPGAGGVAAGAAGVSGGVAAAAIVASAAVSVIATQDLLSKTTLAQRRATGGLRAQQYQGSDAAMTGLITATKEIAPAMGRNFDRWGRTTLTDAVAKGTELGLIHSGVFKKAQTVREALGVKTSREALLSELHSGKPLGVDALVTGQAIALAVGNHLRTDSNPDLKSANYNLRLLQRLQAQLPHALAAQLSPKIASLVAAINRTTDAVNAIHINAITGFATTGPYSHSQPSTPRRLTVAQSQGSREHAAGFLGLTTAASDLGVAGEAGQEAVAILKNPKAIKASHLATVAKVFVTNWPGAVQQTKTASATTAVATTTLAKDTVKHHATTAKEMAKALHAIKERAIAAGHHHPTTAQERATYGRDIKRGDTLAAIMAPVVIKVQSSIRDTNTAQDIRKRWGKTPTQVGAQ